MIRSSLRLTSACALVALIAVIGLPTLAGPAVATESITLPPNGGSQRATVIQQIGLVRVSIEYSSPHVHSPLGEDRKGKIWGQLVPYGLGNVLHSTCVDQCPWRGGANENTVFTTSHDIKVQGKPLPAGAYGLFFIPGLEKWTVIFSKNSTSWGSFWYDPKDDALRVEVKPEAAAYHEVLTYEFPERRYDTAIAALTWENLTVPFTITVDNADELYFENMTRELHSSAGFSFAGWLAASRFCLEHKIHLKEALGWAQKALDPVVGGQENFDTLRNLGDLQAANGLTEEATKTLDRAFRHPSATPVDIHLYGRELLAANRPQEALKIFELNAQLHPDIWPVHVGLALGYSALGRQKEALTEAKLGLPQAPDDPNRQGVERLIKKLEKANP